MPNPSDPILNKEIKPNKRRKPKTKEPYRVDKDQYRYYIDLKNEKDAKERLIEILEFINKKDFGNPLGVKEVLIFAMNKLNQKDLEKIRDSSQTPLEKLESARLEFNSKHKTNYEMEEFLLKRLNLT